MFCLYPGPGLGPFDRLVSSLTGITGTSYTRQGRPETVLGPRQASIFTLSLHGTLKLALDVVVIFLVLCATWRCRLVGLMEGKLLTLECNFCSSTCMQKLRFRKHLCLWRVLVEVSMERSKALLLTKGFQKTKYNLKITEYSAWRRRSLVYAYPIFQCALMPSCFIKTCLKQKLQIFMRDPCDKLCRSPQFTGVYHVRIHNPIKMAQWSLLMYTIDWESLFYFRSVMRSQTAVGCSEKHIFFYCTMDCAI